MKRKSKRNLWNTISAIVLVLLIVAEAVTAFRIWSLEMLPVTYFLIILAILVVLPCLLSLLLFQRRGGKWQKEAGHGKQIVAYILCAVIIAGCLIGNFALSQVSNTLSSITSPSTVNAVMQVYVLTDDPAQAVADAGDYTFGISGEPEREENAKAITGIEDTLAAEISVQSYASNLELIDALYAQEVDAIILDSAYVTILDALDGYTDFTTRTRVLHEHVIEIVETVAPENTANAENTQSIIATTSPVIKDITTTPFLLYISGNDARMQILADGGSDVNILVAVNPVDKQILLINTPRDYYVVNPASGNGSKDKLSHCGLEGIENCIGALTDLYGLPINYYARINFSGFQTLIDALGGVTIHSDISFPAGDHYIYAGENHLNGAQALAFARERYNLTGGDNDRGKNQMKLIAAMINQLSASNLIANYSDILGSLEGMFATSMRSQDLAKLVKMQLSDMASWDIKSFAVTGENGNDKCWAVNNGYGYVMYPHENMVNHAIKLMQTVLDGEVLTDEDLIVE